MPEVVLQVGGRPHTVACREGEEARVRSLGTVIDRHWPAAMRAAGGFNTERAMFLVALMLADELDETQNRPPAAGEMSEPALAKLAERLERLADTLEQTPANA